MYKAVLISILLPLVTCQDDKLQNNEAYLSNLDVDFSQPTYDQILYRYLHPEDTLNDLTRAKRQVKQPESFRQLSLPQIEIPFRDMASIVSEAEAAIINRFEVLEPQIYNSNARKGS